MSGIAGIIHFDGACASRALVEAMTAAIAHRGGDGKNFWHLGPAAIGHAMLRTTPESLEETQPLANESESVVLTLDGRVDNWLELRRELLAAGAVLRDRSDAELVLRSYETWGEECVRRIEGDFAFVAWDAGSRRAFCARDPTGNKPFYYSRTGNTFTFASELRALMQVPWVKPSLDEGMVAEFLAGEWHSTTQTLWSGIHRLPAATAMSISRAGVRTAKYWAPDQHADLGYRTDAEFVDHYRALLFDIVRRMSRSHRPLAMEASGGLDSSAVLAIAEHLRREGRLLAPSLEAYTVTVEGDPGADEVRYARALSGHLGIPIREVPASVLAPAWYAERAEFYRDFPGFPNASMFEGIRELAAELGCRATLGGEGGDSWLEGSRFYYADELRARRWSTALDLLRDDARECGWKSATKWLIKYGLVARLPAHARDFMAPLLERRGPGERPDAPYWLSRAMTERLRAQARQSVPSVASRFRHPGQREMLESLDDAFGVQIIERWERDAARHGQEIRHPFQSPALIQFLVAMPERLRLRGATTKYIHRRALRGVLPEQILERNTKAEFSGVWRPQLLALAGGMRTAVPERHPDWLDPEGVSRLCDTLEREPERRWPLWVLWSIYCCDRFAADVPESPICHSGEMLS